MYVDIYGIKLIDEKLRNDSNASARAVPKFLQ